MGETLAQDLIEDAHARQQARRTAMAEFRPRRTALLAGTGLVLAVGGGGAAVQILSTMIGEPVWIVPAGTVRDALHHAAWHDRPVLAVAAGLVVAGAWLLLSLVPGRPRREPVQGTDARLAGAVSRRDLRRELADAALDVPGIERARIRLRGHVHRRVVVRTMTRYRNPANSADLVRQAVRDRLDGFGLMRHRRIDVRLTWRDD
ncbi:DUF6286 domain-containing protein [Actinomadura rupiterrae]|uniref:DUF6286 domain-containing protein n=1 Tax=Actinomadura rupiterrae TaxID=559627 RepID=UPI0020A5FECB|nr:DUF6286 domain-containing protein [Actinomadura rupiterrae]MCP2334877.1 CBS domain-containing protein [Actinomadura rupiterrae]